MTRCPNCNSKKYFIIFDFGYQPWCGDFTNYNEIFKVKKYPLKFISCKSCKLVRLSKFVDKKIMFQKTTYLSGSSKELIEHFKKTTKQHKKRFKIESKSKILDIGSNDGSYLKFFKKNIHLGIESSENIGKIANLAGIKTKIDFFNYNIAKDINRKFDLIHASGILFHIEDINSALRGIKYLLSKDGVLIVEFIYLKKVIDDIKFDQVYHEHLLMYNLKTLNDLLIKHGLEIFDCELKAIHGGQMIAYVSHVGKKKNTKRFNRMYNLEIKSKANEISYFKNFKKIITNSKKNVLKYFNNLRKQNKLVVGLGAPAKGNTFINYYKLDYRHIDFLMEVNSLRINKFAPGSAIPVVIENKVESKPDVVIVLIWNLKKEVTKKIYKQFKYSKFIFPKDLILNKL